LIAVDGPVDRQDSPNHAADRSDLVVVSPLFATGGKKHHRQDHGDACDDGDDHRCPS
jgi:hypothetical protein